MRAAWFLLVCASAWGQQMLPLTGATAGVHDPVMAQGEDGRYYLFSTNGRPPELIPVKCSTDLLEWKACGGVFQQLPEWATREIPGARAPWAPDLSYSKRQREWRLYYSISTFGKRESAIGLAVTKSLAEPKWEDRGLVVRSHETDDFNAIDPNLAEEPNGRQWLVWGSFWGGIQMRRVVPATGKLDEADPKQYRLAARKRTAPENGSVEAPFLHRQGKYWYLFVSFDVCCQGAKSTYRVMVGRSKQITGPYLDRAGRPMAQGGGTEVLAARPGGAWRGPGHCAVVGVSGGRQVMVFHAYDGKTGRSALKISTLGWKDGWPVVGELE